MEESAELRKEYQWLSGISQGNLNLEKGIYLNPSDSKMFKVEILTPKG